MPNNVDEQLYLFDPMVIINLFFRGRDRYQY